MTVGSIAVSIPGAPAVLEKLGIDYCCGGRALLEQMCAKKGLDVSDVIGAIRQAAAGGRGETRDWSLATMEELTRNIETTHHQYLKDELPRLLILAAKVARVHGDKDHRLVQLERVLGRFAEELTEHMLKEENVLFPTLRTVERDGAHMPPGIERPIACMMEEHTDAGDALERMRELTDGFTPPLGACGSWRVLLTDLARLERDMHEHVHQENNILFPRAMSLRPTA
jgi:regulator of cell morphogenesis and NO signaling